MALLSMLLKQDPFRTKFQDGRPKDASRVEDLLVIQATMRESSVRTIQVTDFPIEDGTDGSDHAIIKPITYSIDGVLSENPLNISSQIAGLVTAGSIKAAQVIGGFKGAESIAGFAAGITGASAAAGKIGGKLMGESSDPFKVVLDGMILIASQRRIITIVSKHEKFENMILTSLKIERDADTGKAVRFSAEARQLQIVKAETVTLQKVRNDAAHSAGAKQNNGKQAATPANEEESKASSAIFKIGQGFGVIK